MSFYVPEMHHFPEGCFIFPVPLLLKENVNTLNFSCPGFQGTNCNQSPVAEGSWLRRAIPTDVLEHFSTFKALESFATILMALGPG